MGKREEGGMTCAVTGCGRPDKWMVRLNLRTLNLAAPPLATDPLTLFVCGIHQKALARRRFYIGAEPVIRVGNLLFERKA